MEASVTSVGAFLGAHAESAATGSAAVLGVEAGTTAALVAISAGGAMTDPGVETLEEGTAAAAAAPPEAN